MRQKKLTHCITKTNPTSHSTHTDDLYFCSVKNEWAGLEALLTTSGIFIDPLTDLTHQVKRNKMNKANIGAFQWVRVTHIYFPCWFTLALWITAKLITTIGCEVKSMSNHMLMQSTVKHYDKLIWWVTSVVSHYLWREKKGNYAFWKTESLQQYAN